ncbi:MAG: DUF4870 domain-containing protein [Chloroflexi bacterium]|nr:DUF4870 domain-containing protein [Chloroflexota bacterium]
MLNENSMTRDERLNATLAHASILLGAFSRGMLGILLAFLIWLTQRNKSKFVARHAAQATVYQLVGVLVTLGVWISWGLIFAGSIFVPLVFDSQNPEPLMLYTMIPALVMMIVPFSVMLAWFGYGLYAAWQVWHGKDFAYPILGRWIK